MSQQTLDGIAAAIQAHLEEGEPGAVLTDWFVSYGSMRHDPMADEGIVYGLYHSASETSPQAAVGIARLGLRALEASLDDGAEES